MGFSSLEIGKSALLAQRYGLEVTSNNIANANTDGYSRKRADLKTKNSLRNNGHFYGTGVIIDELRSFRESFFDREIRSSISNKSAFESDQKILKKLESILSEPSENGLGNLISDFFISWDNLASSPENTAFRQDVLSKAQRLTDRFHLMAESIENTRTDILSDMNSNINQVNSLSNRIAKLNSEMSSNKNASGEGDLNAADEREVLLEELSQYGKTEVSHNDDGTVNVYMNGINLVTGRKSNELKLVESTNNTTGERTIGVFQTDNEGNLQNKINPGSGKLGSQIKHFNETLDGLDTSGNFSFAKNINNLAKEIAANVNSKTTSGFGLNDTSITPPGRVFFNPSLSDATAFNIEVNLDLLQNPEDIPLSSVAGESGNNQIALQVAGLADDLNFIDSMTPGEYFSNILSKSGNMLNDAETGLKNSTLVSDQLSNQRESIIGVNLDEEAINLIKFQRSFEAASRIVNTSDEVLATLVNLGR